MWCKVAAVLDRLFWKTRKRVEVDRQWDEDFRQQDPMGF